MNRYQTTKPTHSEPRRLPAVQLRDRDIVILRAETVSARDGSAVRKSLGKLAENVGQCQGGIEAVIVKIWHSGHGKLSAVLKHPNAAHPTGLEQIETSAVNQFVAKSAL